MERWAKILLGLELLLLALPVTLAFVLLLNFGLGLLIGTASTGWGWTQLAGTGLMLLIAVFLYCFWKLVYIFYSGGAAGLSAASRVLWLCLQTAMAYSLMGALVIGVDQVLPGSWAPDYELPLAMLELGVAGLPVVVPALHLLWIKCRAKPGFDHSATA